MKPRLGGWPNRILVTLLYLFLLAPILIVLLISVDTQSTMSFPPQGFSLQWYRAIWDNEAFTNGFKVSLFVALGVACVATILGVLSSLALSRYSFPGRASLSAFFLSPLLVPAIVLGLALLLVLDPIGLTGTYPGLIIAHLAVTVPYIIRTTSMSLMTLNRSCEEAARTLGASSLTTFRRVTLPLVLPGVLSGFVIAFIISFDEAVISLFVVRGDVTTLPVEIFNYVETRTDPQIAALSVVLILISLLVVIVLERAMGLRKVLK
jgi:putative spermidine/putrescine transport system permease protein